METTKTCPTREAKLRNVPKNLRPKRYEVENPFDDIKSLLTMSRPKSSEPQGFANFEDIKQRLKPFIS